MKTTWLVTVSTIVLTGTLVASGFMLFRAHRTRTDLEARMRHDDLLSQRDRLRAGVADLVARRRVTGLPRSQESLAEFRSALEATAAGFAAAPLDGGPSPQPFACVAMEFAGGAENLEIWTSAPLGPGDQRWVLRESTASLATETEGGTLEVGPIRIGGAAWAAYRVAGRVRVAALVWMSPRSR